MMSLIILWAVSLMQISNTSEIAHIRNLHEKAYSDEKQTAFFYDYMKRFDQDKNALTQGYLGVSKIFMAQTGYNPWKKFTYFNEGKDVLEKAITLDKNNVELRYLRLSVQENAPSFLNYSDDLAEDRTYILNHWNELNDEDIKYRMACYFSKNPNLTAEQKKEFESYRTEHLKIAENNLY